MPRIAIVARVTVKAGKADEYVAAFAPLLEQAETEPGTLLYAVHRAKDDPRVFWTTEVYADDAAFAAHRASERACCRFIGVHRTDRRVRRHRRRDADGQGP